MLDSCRFITNLEQKILLSTLFIFCYNDSKTFANLLYTDELESFLIDLENNNHEIIKEQDYIQKIIYDKFVLNAFYRTREVLIKKLDNDNFLKCLFENDPMAIAVYEISNIVSSKKFLKYEF
jgi:hypothetical protein